MLLLLVVNFESGFRLELIHIFSNCKYQAKPHSSPWFSAACATAIIHRNNFFHLYQQNKSSESKVKFRQASNCCKRVLDVLRKQKNPSLPRNLVLGIFPKLLPVFSKKINLLYFLYLTLWRCCLLLLIKQNCLLKTLLTILIL